MPSQITEEQPISQVLQIKVTEKVIGEGGFGEVLEGEWKNKKVAVKRILKSAITTRDEEEEALKMLEHPNVIKLLRFESDDIFMYYALELCQHSLENLFLKYGDPEKYNGPMPSIGEVLLQLAKGLEYIHKIGLIHRDIKPENVHIWVNPENGQVLMKWADFGLRSCRSLSSSRVNEIFYWFPPEILRLLNDEPDIGIEKVRKQNGNVESDVFAEGLVFGHILLNGRKFHIFGKRVEIPSNILENDQVNINEIKPESIRQLIEDMIKYEPTERISSKEVVDRLTTIKNQTPH